MSPIRLVAAAGVAVVLAGGGAVAVRAATTGSSPLFFALKWVNPGTTALSPGPSVISGFGLWLTVSVPDSTAIPTGPEND